MDIDGIIGSVLAMNVLGRHVGARVKRVVKSVHRREQMHREGFAVVVGEIPNLTGEFPLRRSAVSLGPLNHPQATVNCKNMAS